MRTLEPTRGISAALATHDIARSLLAEFETELGTTRRFLERIPADRLAWRPHEKSMTAGQLALHIAQVPAGTLKFSLADEETAPDFSTGWAQPKDLSEILEALDSCAAEVRQVLPDIDDSRMRDTFSVVQAGRTLMAMPRANLPMVLAEAGATSSRSAASARLT